MYEDILSGFDEVWSRVQLSKRPNAEPEALIEAHLRDSAAFNAAARKYPEYRRLFSRLASEELSHARTLRGAFGIYGQLKPGKIESCDIKELIKREKEKASLYAALSETGKRRGLFRRLRAEEERHLREMFRALQPKFDLPKEWGSSSDRR